MIKYKFLIAIWLGVCQLNRMAVALESLGQSLIHMSSIILLNCSNLYGIETSVLSCFSILTLTLATNSGSI